MTLGTQKGKLTLEIFNRIEKKKAQNVRYHICVLSPFHSIVMS